MRVQFSSAAPICLPGLKPLQMQTFFKSSAAHLFPYVSATTIANTIIMIIIIININITNTIIINNTNTSGTTITTTDTVATIAITSISVTITTITTAATLIALPDNEMQRITI